MSDLADISKAISGMKTDLANLGECDRMLASPGLVKAMFAIHKEHSENVGSPNPTTDGTLYFRGAPVVECNDLKGLEYSFVTYRQGEA